MVSKCSKSIINILKVILVSSSLFISCQHAKKNEFISYSDPLREKYQNYLKTDSYAVLTDKDFKNYPVQSYALKFEKLDRELPVWICTSTKNINFVCADKDYSNQSNAPDDSFDSSFSFEQEGILYAFITRRGLPIDSCREQVHAWKNLARNQEFVCAAGEPLNEDKNSNGQLKRTLIYQLVKSKKNCLSWFEGACDNTI